MSHKEPQKLSGVVITLNEASKICACLEALFRVCDEVVVVDSVSSDSTCELAKELGARVVQRNYQGTASQRNYGASLCEHQWVLTVDADEVLDEQLISSLLVWKKSNLNVNTVYSLERLNFIGDRPISHSGWSKDYVGRLYHHLTYEFEGFAHSSIVAKTTSTVKPGLLNHYSFDSYGDLLHKTNKFSNRAAYLMFSDPTKAAGPVVALIHGLSAFLKKYIVKGGMFHGMDGLVIASVAGLGSFMKYAKLYEYRKNKSRPSNPWG